MDTKPLLFGLIGFFIGGLLVSVAATTFDKPAAFTTTVPTGNSLSMTEMTESLRDKKGDDYDKLFIQHMIGHHESAVDMARLSADRAKHDEIKKLSLDIITAQEREIDEMRHWQTDWGYGAGHGTGAPSAH